jgi:hypothetical protein
MGDSAAQLNSMLGPFSVTECCIQMPGKDPPGRRLTKALIPPA